MLKFPLRWNAHIRYDIGHLFNVRPAILVVAYVKHSIVPLETYTAFRLSNGEQLTCLLWHVESFAGYTTTMLIDAFGHAGG